MAINKKRTQSLVMDKADGIGHLNFMGGKSFDINSPLLRLICMSASSFFGEPMYYKGQRAETKKVGRYVRKRDGIPGDDLSNEKRSYLRKVLNAIDDYDWRNMKPVDAMIKAITESLAFNPEETLKLASALRNRENIRVTPQIILVVAANTVAIKGTGLVRKYAPEIIRRADEPAIQLAFQLEHYGRPIPNSLKRAWSDFLEKSTEYQLAKYRMESRVVKTVDVASLAHGKGFYGYDTAVGKLLRGELKLGDDNKTWESIISAGGKWNDAIEVMGHMALLRNIRNLLEHKVPTKNWIPKLIETARNGKQLPFRYVSAYKANDRAGLEVLSAIEDCLMLSIGNLPRLEGSSLVLVDNSGSTRSAPISELSSMGVYEIGNLMGVLTGMASDKGVVGVFGDRLEYVNVEQQVSVFSQLERINKVGSGIGGGTENGIWLAFDDAIRNNKHWDNIFVYSDMQAGHGGLYGTNNREYKDFIWGKKGGKFIDVPRLVQTYRNKVNKNVNVFLVQIAGYEDTLLPEFFDRTYILGGWSDSILKFASCMINTMNQVK